MVFTPSFETDDLATTSITAPKLSAETIPKKRKICDKKLIKLI